MDVAVATNFVAKSPSLISRSGMPKRNRTSQNVRVNSVNDACAQNTTRRRQIRGRSLYCSSMHEKKLVPARLTHFNSRLDHKGPQFDFRRRHIRWRRRKPSNQRVADPRVDVVRPSARLGEVP